MSTLLNFIYKCYVSHKTFTNTLLSYTVLFLVLFSAFSFFALVGSVDQPTTTPLCKLIETNIQTFIYPHFLAGISVN